MKILFFIVILLIGGCSEKFKADPVLAGNMLRNCNIGYPSGCYILAGMNRRGKGVVENKKFAVELYSKACDLNYGLGCYELGQMYDSGEGVERDVLKANKFLEKACEDSQFKKIASGCD